MINWLNKYKDEPLVLFTRNEGKIRELRQLLAGTGFKIASINEFPGAPEIIEDGSTFASNALKKAREGALALGKVTLADDSGLEVDYLNGAPGVHSARFAYPGHNDLANNQKLLRMLRGVPLERRTARFCCVIAIVTPEGQEILFEGTCEGVILDELRGVNGFGYDPLFFLPQFGKTFAELDDAAKNAISHRGRALQQVRDILAAV